MIDVSDGRGSRDVVRAAAVLDALPWRRVTWRQGTKGALSARFAMTCVRVGGRHEPNAGGRERLRDEPRAELLPGPQAGPDQHGFALRVAGANGDAEMIVDGGELVGGDAVPEAEDVDGAGGLDEEALRVAGLDNPRQSR